MHGYEAVMHARFEQAFKLPTRLACYESFREVQSRLRSERPKLARTAIAWRFLIECVAAVPPQGDAPCSLTTRGELLALAAEMQDVASTLDAIDNGIIGHSARALPHRGARRNNDGRLTSKDNGAS